MVSLSPSGSSVPGGRAVSGSWFNDAFVRGVPALVDDLAQLLLGLPRVGSYGVMRGQHIGLWEPWGLVPLYA